MISSNRGALAISAIASFQRRGGRTVRPGIPETLMSASSRRTFSCNTSFRPNLGDTPKLLVARGRRISASNRQVSPCSAKAEARLTDSIVLPSPAVDETIRMTKLECFPFISKMEDFKLRTASASGDHGFLKTKILSWFRERLLIGNK